PSLEIPLPPKKAMYPRSDVHAAAAAAAAHVVSGGPPGPKKGRAVGAEVRGRPKPAPGGV
ncbi:MAG: hypothetical protein OK454_09550, partial [Thaumarchaeota archaeon]|nr:hypothetical protein [Nitrososphaerota archaeon]